MRPVPLLLTLALLLPASLAFAQTGKVAGVVTDQSGSALPGVNVSLDGTTQGAVTNVDGYYVILNVRPGSYTLRATFIGFTTELRENIRVNVDLTTEIDFALREETVGLDEIVVAAERPVVQRDVSASVANVTAEEIENLPVTDIEKIVGLQAGFEPNLTVRGFGGDQVQFMVDGQSMNSGRTNEPYTGVSYTSVQEYQVQTGGFNAEYGNVRSGLINVITKEPDRNRYSFDAIVRYSPASQYNFEGVGIDGGEVAGLLSRNSYVYRPMTDPDVAMDGTSNWPSWMQTQYMSFPGWNAIADNYNSLNGTDFTGEEIQAVFTEHYLRKPQEVDLSNYEIDATVGGPVPLLDKLLGDLRFQASYRQTQNPYEYSGYPRDAFKEQVGQAKLISNFSAGMKLLIQGMYSKQQGLNQNEAGWPDLTTGDQINYPWDEGYRSMYQIVGSAGTGDDLRNFGEYNSPIYFQLMDVDRLMLGAQFTHTLSPSTFYEVQVQSMSTDYDTRKVGDRSEDPAFEYLEGRLRLDEAPYGYSQKDRVDDTGVGMRTSGHWSSGYDRSTTDRFSGRFDITSQLNRFLLGKAGVEYIYQDFNVDYGEDDPEHPHNGDQKWEYHRKPQQAAAYAQAKLEFKGMIANLGLRLDYFHAGGDWYQYEPYDRAFTAQFGISQIDEVLTQEPIDRLVALSPRLGVSFPVTDNSKLYFNYGHFRSQLQPLDLFEVQYNFTGAIVGIGNPDHPMPKTVAYELGFEQNLFDEYLLRLAGYYRDLSDQPRDVNFISVDDLVDYEISQPWNYGDVRGLEITLSKNRGDWIRGFVNYTYMVRKTGDFGFSQFDENTTAQNNFVTSTDEHYTSKPIPEPYARWSLEVLFPKVLAGSRLLGDWRINFLGEWRKGQSMTWDGQNLTLTDGAGPRDLQGNVRFKDYWMLDMRISKNFATDFGGIQLFVDINNILNLRHMYLGRRDEANFRVFELGSSDLRDYMQSLHLPQETIPDSPDEGLYGDDQPGDYRAPGVGFVPIIQGDLPDSGEEHPLYYVPSEGKYYEWNGTAFVDANSGRVSQVLDDKAYIDMPNKQWSTWLYPRDVYFGLRLTF
jgi:outer membrane receptor protein involved in Fe transport